MKIPKIAERLISKTVNFVTAAVTQTSNAKERIEIPPADGIAELCRLSAAEGCVLLKNENNILPLSKERTLSVFGRVQNNTFFVGYGSGGDVNAHYNVSIMEALQNSNDITINPVLSQIYADWCKENPVNDGFWGHWPMCYDEMPVEDEIVKNAAENSDTAMVVIGRAAGEDRENTLTKGSFYLTDEEDELLKKVSTSFEKTVVVLNIGSIFDFSWVEKYNIGCVLILWQGGMETGNALADIISGKVSPSGKLSSSIAKKYECYPSAEHFGDKQKNKYTEDIFVGYRYFETFSPDDVLFCFGHGLTYSDFCISDVKFSEDKDCVKVQAKITNTGKAAAKEVVQLYCSAPQGVLGKSAMHLCAFSKTDILKPKGSCTVTLSVKKAELASYDDAGQTGNKSSYVLEEGTYKFCLGFSVRDNKVIGSFEQKETVVTQQLTETSAVEPEEAYNRLTAVCVDGKIIKKYKPVPTRTASLRSIIKYNLPKDIPLTGDMGITLKDVKDGINTLDEFVAQLTPVELEAITRGDYVMNSPLGAKGNASVFGGVLPSLREKRIPAITCTDGPSGIRLSATSALLPSGTSLASTWNTKLVSDVYAALGTEMVVRGSDVLLAPGMNIHRNPLCGRNFEYFSEDPFLCGNIAAAVVNGLQSSGVSACPKHFACNNQETKRTVNNSILSERALREIYLKGFEICVKNAKPQNIMTSYNKINGVWGHYNYDLCTTILRKEWGYTGCVMTDWWMQPSASPEFPLLKNQAYRVRAQVDVLMPGGSRSGKRKPDGTLLASLCKEDGITLGEMQQCAKNVLNFALNSQAFLRENEE